MKYRYVAIEREYGSGGLEIGKRLAEKHGIPCYNHEIVELAAHKAGVEPQRILHMEENITDSPLYSMYVLEEQKHPTEMDVHRALQSAVEELAINGPAVFVGHGALKTLKLFGSVLPVFVYADREKRMNRTVEDCGIPASAASMEMMKADRRRASYFYFNTRRSWDSSMNYHIMLDSGKTGIDNCVSAINVLLTDPASD